MRSWVLGGTTLPNPQGFKQDYIELSMTHETITGRSVKQVRNRKRRYTLSYTLLTQAEATTIKNLQGQNAALAFAATDGSLAIPSTQVHVTIKGETFPAKGSEFRQNLDLILTEVS